MTTEDEVERRAKALAGIIIEHLPGTDAQDPTLIERSLKEGTIAESEAYWLVYSLKDPAGETGFWHANKQVDLLEKALKGLGRADKAIRELASPVEMEISRRTKFDRGLATAPF